MARQLLLAALVCAAAFASRPVAAAVFERDWKTPGDGLLTYDDVSGREWLDLPVTTLADPFPFPGEDRDAKYQYVVSQTGPGGLFEGFTVAKSADARALAQSAGITTSSQKFPINSIPTLHLGDLLGYTVPPSDQRRVTVGLLDEMEIRDPNPDLRVAALLLTVFNTQSGLQIGSGQFQFPSPPGVMLYRAIPEPSTLAIAATCLIGVSAIRGRVKNYLRPCAGAGYNGVVYYSA